MINVLEPEHQEVIQLFNKHKVKYLLVGGYAVNYYGYTRNTGDMDFWVKPTNENKNFIIPALQDFGIDSLDLVQLEKEDFTKHVVFSLGLAPEKIDFITKVNLVDFDEAYKKLELFELDGVEIPIIHYNDLILTKINTGRLIDKNDVDMLQKIYGKDMKP